MGGFGGCGLGAGLHPVSEDDDGGHLIDDVFAIALGVAGFVEDLVGGDGGEALVPEVDGEVGALAEFGGELLDFGGPGGDIAGEVEGVADDYFGDFVPAGEAGEVAEIFASGFAVEGEEGLGGVAEGVGEGYADADFADVEGEGAEFALGFQVCPIHGSESLSPGTLVKSPVFRVAKIMLCSRAVAARIKSGWE